MNTTARSLLLALACCAAAAFPAAAASNPGSYDFGPALAGASSTRNIDICLPEALLAFAATVTKCKDEDAAALVRDLKQINVNVLGLDENNRADITSRMRKIRAELNALGWHRTAAVQDKGDDVNVHVKLSAQATIEGLAITVLSKTNDAVFVNIVGNIDPARIAALGERYNIEPLKNIHCPASAPGRPQPSAPPVEKAE